MNTRLSKMFCLLLAVTFILLSLASCGGGQNPSTSDAQSADSDIESDSPVTTADGSTTTDTTDDSSTTEGKGSTNASSAQTSADVSNSKTSDSSTTKAKTTTTTGKSKSTKTTQDDFKGTTYYVSSSTGDDWADGDSQNAPVKSLATASSLASDGDRVLLKRGDVWRGDCLTAKSGVIYGAYGTGDAPKIYGSAQNYSVKGKWKATSNSRIYYFDQTIASDIGGIVFNDGSAYGARQASQSSLSSDRQYFYDYSAKRVYLYSRKGNPADVWSSIEFIEYINLISIKGNDVTIQDLELRYGDYGIVGGNNKNVTIKNCDFSWIGGCIHNHANTLRYGNAVEFYGGIDGLLVDHCNFNQIFDTAITAQYQGAKTTIQNVTVSNNKINNCQWSLEFWLECKDGSGKYVGTIKNIKILNNEFSNAGKGWSAGQRMGSAPASSACHFMTMSADGYSVSDIVFKKNTFEGSAGNMMTISWTKYTPTFEGNTFIQTKDKDFAYLAGSTIKYNDANMSRIKALDSTGKFQYLS